MELPTAPKGGETLVRRSRPGVRPRVERTTAHYWPV